MTVASRFPRADSLRRPLPALLILALVAAALAPMASLQVARGLDLARAEHLVVSEVVTGGASASDELIELHNPTDAALPLEGLEVVYVTASGATVSRRATWALGAPRVPPGGHVLIANASGIYASIADATYASGMAATGGSVAIRILGASTAIDAAGWGTAAGTWLEGTPSAAPTAGSSIERLPGGPLGSAQDTDDNAVDFVERLVPEPQNLGSAPTPDPAAPTPSAGPSSTPEPSGTPQPTPAPPSATPAPTAAPPSATPAPTAAPPSATPAPSAAPTPPSLATPVADSRALPDGTTVTIEAVALTASDFHDGGGFVADATGGIAVLPAGGSFAPGDLLRITGEIDDRFSQRTLRADPGGSVALGTGEAPAPTTATTGAIGEALEGRLVRIGGTILGSATPLTSGLAFDLDDGSGVTRVVVGTATGIDTAGWLSGSRVDLVGVAGQRDSTGSGTDGYRVLPRNPADVTGITSPSASPTPSSSPDIAGMSSIADARDASKETQLRVRGVVTLPTGLVDDRTAVLQDASGAILLRLGEDAGRLRLGTKVEVDGRRSTFGGMESLRVTNRIVSLGTASEPAAREIRTGDPAASDEATLVVARGAIVASARRSPSGTVSFEIDDGSGPLRISLMSRLRADRGPLVAGSWVEVRGVLGQETSRSKPDEGYRIWPRAAGEVRVTAPVTGGDGSGGPGSGPGGDGSGGGGPAGSLDDLDDADLAQLRIGATLVVGRWREVGIGGLLWDGTSLVGVHLSSNDVVARLTRDRRPPLALDLGGLQAAGTEPASGVPLVKLGSASTQTAAVDAPPTPPRATLDGDLPAWVSVVGQLSRSGRILVVEGERLALHHRCGEEEDDDDDERGRLGGAASVTGVALNEPLRLLVPCGGVRPAPMVAGGTALAAIDGKDGPIRAAGSAATPPAADTRRPIVAGLLLAAAAVLVGGAMVGRRRGTDAHAPAEDGDVAQAGEPAPRLTLVPVPHEHGP